MVCNEERTGLFGQSPLRHGLTLQSPPIGSVMSVQQIKSRILAVIADFPEFEPYELRRIFSEAMLDHQRRLGWSEGNKGESWTDDELRVILSDAPTKDNCLKHARAFGRGYGSIEQIYRWAAASDATIRQKRPDDSFIQQIKRVAKQLGWRA